MILKNNSGQILPVTLGLALVVAVCLFMVLNSHRAVDEKINLVNAADAVAYSGAQMAARELNFMALTNRAMIANEVAIGHVMAYQTELDVVADALKNGVGGLIGALIEGLLLLIGGDATIDNFNEINRIWSSAYMLAVNATNALYQDYQEDDYRALAGLERDSLLDAVMGTVAQQYQLSPAVTIEVNSTELIDQLRDFGSTSQQALAEAAASNPFCNMIVFAQPSAAGGPGLYDKGAVNRFRALNNQCENYYRNGNVPNGIGSLDRPVDDSGVLIDLLRASAERAPSADWVMSRDDEYRVLLGVVGVERRGASEVMWDETNRQVNWKTVGSDTIRTTSGGALLRFSGQAEGDAKVISDTAATQMGGALSALLRTAGLCEEIDCDSLQNTSYTGMSRYAILNPLLTSNAPGVSPSPMVTAILQQNGNCNDDLGRINKSSESPDGKTLNSTWDDNLPMFDDVPACSSDKNILAYAQARLFYQRPSCDPTGLDCTIGFSSNGVTGEQPNLFNPFWQASLAPAL